MNQVLSTAGKSPVTLLTVKDVQSRVRFSRTKLYELISEGVFPKPVRIGGSSRWRSDDVDMWIDQVTGRGA